MLCILYVIGLGACLGMAASSIERLLPPTASRRWVWLAAIAVNMTIPGIYRTKHASSLSDSASAQVGPFLESAAPLIENFWLAASLTILIWSIGNIVRVTVLIHRRKTQTIDGIPVIVTGSLGPATVGLLKSKVLVPRWVLALPAMQRRYILKHEAEHRSAHDSLLLFVASLSLVLVPWNLSLWWLLKRLRLAVEMDCDNRVVGALGNPNAYGELLFKVAEASSRGPALQPAFLGAAGMLERRLRGLIAPEPLRAVQRVVLPLVAAILMILAFTTPHPVVSTSSQAHSSPAMNHD